MIGHSVLYRSGTDTFWSVYTIYSIWPQATLNHIRCCEISGVTLREFIDYALVVTVC